MMDFNKFSRTWDPEEKKKASAGKNDTKSARGRVAPTEQEDQESASKNPLLAPLATLSWLNRDVILAEHTPSHRSTG